MAYTRMRANFWCAQLYERKVLLLYSCCFPEGLTCVAGKRVSVRMQDQLEHTGRVIRQGFVILVENTLVQRRNRGSGTVKEDPHSREVAAMPRNSSRLQVVIKVQIVLQLVVLQLEFFKMQQHLGMTYESVVCSLSWKS